MKVCNMINDSFRCWSDRGPIHLERNPKAFVQEQIYVIMSYAWPTRPSAR